MRFPPHTVNIGMVGLPARIVFIISMIMIHTGPQWQMVSAAAVASANAPAASPSSSSAASGEPAAAGVPVESSSSLPQPSSSESGSSISPGSTERPEETSTPGESATSTSSSSLALDSSTASTETSTGEGEVVPSTVDHHDHASSASVSQQKVSGQHEGKKNPDEVVTALGGSGEEKNASATATRNSAMGIHGGHYTFTLPLSALICSLGLFVGTALIL